MSEQQISLAWEYKLSGTPMSMALFKGTYSGLNPPSRFPHLALAPVYCQGSGRFQSVCQPREWTGVAGMATSTHDPQVQAQVPARDWLPFQGRAGMWRRC